MLVQDEEIFQDFCHSRGLASGSVKLYRIALQKYSNYTNKTLEDLIQEADDEEEERIRMRKRKIREYLVGFRQWLDEQNTSKSYANHTVALVRSFYTEYDIELPRTFKRKSRRDKKIETFEDLPTMEDVKKALDYCSPTYKAITLLMVSSGMSRAEICSLTFKHFYEAVNLPTDLEISIPDLIEKVKAIDSLIPMWKIYRIKTGKPYFTFSTPQATDAILDYLDQHYREYEWQPKPDDQLFRSYNNPVKPDAVTEQYRRINSKAGFRKVNNRLLVRPHSLRKLFATTLERNRMPHLMTRWLMGHTIDSTTNSYFKADPETIKVEYLEIINQISTDQVEVKIIRTEAYEEIKAEIDAMKEEIFFSKRKSNLADKLERPSQK